ncbi:MAG: GNAT family N-acetyltransferase [Methylobacteriaceae bacterium]|nr:GNAT family N-acetyltransferase [Methylobacteriaceae bacterium]
MTGTLAVAPLTPDRWADLVDLFGPERGACAGCWCMWPRLKRADWTALGRDGRRDAFHAIVNTGPPPGLLAFRDGVAVAWVAVGPRLSVPRFDAMKTSAPVAADADRDRAFALTCFYVRNDARRQGLTRVMAQAAAGFAKQQGATSLEVCAIEADRPLTWGDGFVGIASVFRALGWREVARRAPRRPLMRLDL